jgi:hypothetical protein
MWKPSWCVACFVCVSTLAALPSVSPQSSSVNLVEDLRLEVVPCSPGYYCAPDGSILEPCPEGSEHVILEEEDKLAAWTNTPIDEFAICSSGQTRALAVVDTDTGELLDVGFVIDYDLTPRVHQQQQQATGQENANGDDDDDPEESPSQDTMPPQEPVSWTQLLDKLSQAPNVLDVSIQEYVALDVTRGICPKGYYCNATDHGVQCPLGAYAPEKGLSACLQCPWGLTSAKEASVSFQNCTLADQGATEVQWLPLRLPQALDDALPLEPQLAAFYGVSVEAMVTLSVS